MTTFDDREKGYEKKFALDQDLKFRSEARRNKMLAEWAAAIEQSSERVTMLLTDDWIPDRGLMPGDEEQELENLLESLDQSRSLLAGA